MKKIFAVLLITVLFSFYGLPSFAADVPTLRASYGITTHQEAFMVAMARRRQKGRPPQRHRDQERLRSDLALRAGSS